MTIAHDARSQSADASTSTALSWTHTPSGTPKGVIVEIIQDASGSDGVTSVFYGSAEMTRIAFNPHASGESGATYLYALTSGVPTGSQTVTINNDGANSKTGHCRTFTCSGGGDMEVVDYDDTVSSNSIANPSVTLSLGGKTCFAAIFFYSGQNAVTGITPLSGWTADDEYDWGTQTSGNYSYNTIGSSDVTAGYTQAADDSCMIAYAVAEAAATGYTLTAAGGAIALTGTAANLERHLKLTAAAGAIAVTGSDATLRRIKTLTAAGGAIALTGTDAGFLYDRALAAAAGAISISGADAGLKQARILTAAAGAIAVTGSDATLRRGKTLVAGAGAIAVTGSDAGLKQAHVLTAGAGAIAVTGSDAALFRGKTMAADAGAFSVAGQAATLVQARILSATGGEFTVTGDAAGLLAGRILSATAGAIAVTGSDATLTYTPSTNYTLTADAGAIEISGNDATLTYSGAEQPLPSGGGSYPPPKIWRTPEPRQITMYCRTGRIEIVGHPVEFRFGYDHVRALLLMSL